MRFHSVAVVLGFLAAGCGERPAPVTPGPSPTATASNTGKGTLLVTGTGKDSYLLHDGKGAYLASVKTNEATELAPGTYTVHLGNRVEATVKAGERTTIAAGTLLVTGTGTETFELYDGKGTFQTSVKANVETELAAGAYLVKVNGKDHAIEVVGGKRTDVGR
jgi:uncharacterized membrane protein